VKGGYMLKTPFREKIKRLRKTNIPKKLALDPNFGQIPPEFQVALKPKVERCS
jgi:hypothetical protein